MGLFNLLAAIADGIDRTDMDTAGTEHAAAVKARPLFLKANIVTRARADTKPASVAIAAALKLAP